MSAEVFVFESFIEDPVSENEGIWTEIFKGWRVKVRSMKGEYYTKALREAFDEYRANTGINEVPKEVVESLSTKVAGRELVADWEPVVWKTGEDPVPFSKDAAEEAWRKSRPYRDAITRCALRDDRYMREATQVKN